MKTERLEIGGTLVLEAVTYETLEGIPPLPIDGSFEFTEHSTDHFFSDRQTSISIDADMARKIIEFLKKYFQ